MQDDNQQKETSLPSFSLRPATTEDLAEILRIENAVHVAPWTEDHFRSELTKPYSQFLVFTDDDTDTKIAGYLVCWLMFDECQILNIAVDLPYRGIGFGKQMIRKAAFLTNQKGLTRIVLEVRKSNVAAIQLYQSLRFVITHVRRGFYSNGEDAYHMALSLLEDRFEF